MPEFSNAIAGPLTLYTWKERLSKRDCMVFSANPKAEDEWRVETVKWRVNLLLKEGANVRIENGNHETVFVANRGRVVFPADVDAFWRECGR